MVRNQWDIEAAYEEFVATEERPYLIQTLMNALGVNYILARDALEENDYDFDDAYDDLDVVELIDLTENNNDE